MIGVMLVVLDEADHRVCSDSIYRIGDLEMRNAAKNAPCVPVRLIPSVRFPGSRGIAIFRRPAMARGPARASYVWLVIIGSERHHFRCDHQILRGSSQSARGSPLLPFCGIQTPQLRVYHCSTGIVTAQLTCLPSFRSALLTTVCSHLLI